jgi:hypothetical protein
LVQPKVFARANRIYRRAEQIITLLDLPNKWEVEIAAMLAQIGCITTPLDILKKLELAQDLSERERSQYVSGLLSGSRFVEKIPRLEVVAQIIASQGRAPKTLPAWQSIETVDRVTLGSHILGVAAQMETALARGLPVGAMLLELRSEGYTPALVKIAEMLAGAEGVKHVKSIRSDELSPGMTLESDIVGDNDLLLLAKGQWISPTLLECLRRHYEYSGKEEMVQVRISAGQREGSAVATTHR